jgi:hypothetical protein
MADKKISELTNITGANLADADEFVVVDTSASETKAITYGELKKFTGDVTVSGAITATGGDLDLATLDLSAIDTSIADTAVDVFVYDTSKDSDGGAWRKRTQHTSWYNETLNTATRGSRREFPAVAVIVAERNKVTIYDGDDPSLPMWMVFTGPTGTSTGLFVDGSNQNHTDITAVQAKNAQIVLSKGGNPPNTAWAGLASVSFVSEIFTKSNTRNDGFVGTLYYPISERNTFEPSSGWGLPRSVLVSNVADDVAMTVLPNAPIDPATGLPVPTIAVATDGGVSVIRDDGTVVDLTYTASTNNETGGVWFPKSGGIGWQSRSAAGGYVYTLVERTIPTADKSTAPDALYANFGQANFVGNDLVTLGLSQPQNFIDGVVGSPNGLTLIDENPAAPANGMVAYTTSTYNTGWMNGDTKGAFLSDTDDTDLVGSGELVTNGEDWTGASGATPPTGWSTASSTILFSASGGDLTIDRNGEATGLDMYQTVTTVVGKTYVVELDIVSLTGSLRIDVTGISPFSTANTGVSAYTFVATTTSTYVGLRNTGTTGVAVLNYVRIKLADADRSVNNNGLIVNGTVTRSPVATGAELVAYSGFSASNYLEQPYNSDLDFGTGDFCVMGWVKTNDQGTDVILGRYEASSVAPDWDIRLDSNEFMTFVVDSAVKLQGTTNLQTNRWFLFAVVRTSGTATLYINGRQEASASVATDLTNTSASFGIGGRVVSTNELPFGGSLALLRISATAPTAEQIKKIYEDEKVLFQENAAATLYGASDAVTALAHDSDTGLLHVGTSAGRSVFQGLRRVSNTTTAVGTAISASNGLVVEE